MSEIQILLPDVPPFIMHVHETGCPWLSDVIRQTGAFEPFESKVFARLLDTPVDVYDVGANIGWYSLIAASKLNGRGLVRAFEPCAQNFDLLAHNVAKNEFANVHIHSVALGRETGKSNLYLSKDNPGDHRAYLSNEQRERTSIEVLRFDSIFDLQSELPSVVKIDTQGFEVDVILGMGDLFYSPPQEMILLIEFWPYGLTQRGERVDDFLKIIADAGYRVAVMVEADPYLRHTSFEALSNASRRDLSPEGKGFVNLVLYRSLNGVGASLKNYFADGASPWVPDSW
ncbi:MAG: FkbM family methyltransferase [Hyphomicrobium sp.]